MGGEGPEFQMSCGMALSFNTVLVCRKGPEFRRVWVERPLVPKEIVSGAEFKVCIGMYEGPELQRDVCGEGPEFRRSLWQGH